MYQLFRDILNKIKNKGPVDRELLASSASGQKSNRERKTGYDMTKLDEYWRTSAVLGSSIDDMAMSICGAGFSLAFKRVGTNEYIDPTEVDEVHQVLMNSRQQWVIYRAVHDALKLGNGYILKQYSGDYIVHIKPIPPDNIEILRDPYMNVIEYVQNVGEEKDNPIWDGDNVIHIKLLEKTGAAFGTSVIERVAEDDDILRNMKLDLATVMEKTAYPPEIYQCGTEDKPWSSERIKEFLTELSDSTIGKIVGVSGDVKPVHRDIKLPDISPTMSVLSSSLLNGIGVPVTQTGLISNAGDAIVKSQNNAYMKRVTSYRILLKELLEIQLFDPLLESWGYTDIKAELTWLPMPGEDERMSVNNIVQLKQNSIITRDYAQRLLGFPVGDEMPGTYDNVVDSPEGVSPELQPKDDMGTSEDIAANAGTDNRNGGY